MSLFPRTQMPDREWWSVLWPDPEGVLKKLGVPRGEDAVDLCSGDGYFSGPLSRLAAPGKVYALELDPETADRAREYLNVQGGGNCLVVEDDARNLAAHVPEPVAFALIANTFHGIPDPERRDLVHKVYEAVRPRGLFAIVNWHPLQREQTPVLDEPHGPPTEMRMPLEQTRVAVEPSGFNLERVVELPPYHYGVVYYARLIAPVFLVMIYAEGPVSGHRSSRQFMNRGSPPTLHHEVAGV